MVEELGEWVGNSEVVFFGHCVAALHEMLSLLEPYVEEKANHSNKDTGYIQSPQSFRSLSRLLLSKLTTKNYQIVRSHSFLISQKLFNPLHKISPLRILIHLQQIPGRNLRLKLAHIFLLIKERAIQIFNPDPRLVPDIDSSNSR